MLYHHLTDTLFLCVLNDLQNVQGICPFNVYHSLLFSLLPQIMDLHQRAIGVSASYHT